MGTLFLIVAVLLGIPLGLVGVFVLLPIRVGASGSYCEDARDVRGWARAFAGLLGVVFAYRETGGQVQVVLGPWMVWQPKPEEPDPASEPVATREEPERPTPPAAGEDAQPEVQKVAPEPAREARVVTPKPADSPPDAKHRGAPKESKAQKSKTPEADESPPEQEKKPSLLERWRILRAQLLRYRGYWHLARPILSRLLRRTWRVFGFRSVDLDVVFGAGDPSMTGRVFGYVEAVRPLLSRRTRLVLTPDFRRAHFEVSGKVEFSIYLWRLLWTLGCVAVRGSVVAFVIWRKERRVKRLAKAQEA